MNRVSSMSQSPFMNRNSFGMYLCGQIVRPDCGTEGSRPACSGGRRRGEIAVFTVMILVMAATLLFTAIEGARIAASGFYLQMAADAAAESCFGEYYLPLWDHYRLLFLYEDIPLEERMEDQLELYADAAAHGFGVSFLGFREPHAEAYSAYMTDASGQAFYEEAVDHAVIHLPAEALDLLSAQADLFHDIQDVTDVMGDLGNWSSDVLAEVDQATAAAAAAGGTDGTESDVGGGSGFTGISGGLAARAEAIESELHEVTARFSVEDALPQAQPVDERTAGGDTASFPGYTLAGMAESAFLSYMTGGGVISESVVPEGAAVSAEIAGGADASLQDEDASAGSPLSRTAGFFLFREYLLDQFSGYSAVREDHALSYEWEYLLGGKSSDRANLFYTVNRLLMLRSGIDFLQNLMNEERKAEAFALAAVIAGVTGVPEAVQLIQLAILAVWSANEAVAEVKSLLAGGEVPLLKMSGSGYLNLDYRGYVRLLLYMKRTETLQGRGLDVIQTDMMRRVSTFDVRRCIYSSEIRVTAQSGAVFTRVFAVGGSRMFRGTELFADCGNSYAVERLG